MATTSTNYARVAPWQDTEAARVPDKPIERPMARRAQASLLCAEGEMGGRRLLVAQLTRREINMRDEGAL